MEESGRWALGAGAYGRTAATAQSRRPAAQGTRPRSRLHTGRRARTTRDSFGGAGRGRHLAAERLLPGSARRAGRSAALRRMGQHDPARPQLPPSLAGGIRGHPQGDAGQPRQCRLPHDRRTRAQHLDARSPRGEPDADRRREHRRHRLSGVLADSRRGRVSLQRAAAAGDGKGGRGELDARGGRAHAHPARPVRRSQRGRGGHAGADAAGPRRVWRRHPHHPGQAAEGRSARRR